MIAAGVVFVNILQKSCERSQGQVPPAEGWPGFHVSSRCRSGSDHHWHSLEVSPGDPGARGGGGDTSPALPAGTGGSSGAKQHHRLILGYGSRQPYRLARAWPPRTCGLQSTGEATQKGDGVSREAVRSEDVLPTLQALALRRHGLLSGV